MPGDKNDKSNQRSNYSFVQANDACFLFLFILKKMDLIYVNMHVYTF